MGTVLYLRDRVRQPVAELMLADGARLRLQLDSEGLLIQSCDLRGHPTQVVFGARPRLASALVAGLAAPDGEKERRSPLHIVTDVLVGFARAEDVREAFEAAARAVDENWAADALWRPRTLLDRVMDAGLSMVMVLCVLAVVVGVMMGLMALFPTNRPLASQTATSSGNVVIMPSLSAAPEPGAKGASTANPPPARAALVDPDELRLAVSNIDPQINPLKNTTRLLVSFTNRSPVSVHFTIEHFTTTLAKSAANLDCPHAAIHMDAGSTVRLPCSEIVYGPTLPATAGKIDLAYSYGQGVAGNERVATARLVVSLTGHDLEWSVGSSSDEPINVR